MGLSLRKEQVLALLAVGVGAWIYSGLGSEGLMRSAYNPGRLELEQTPVVEAPLVESPAPANGRSELFTQPRETRPLPPRELDFPPRAPGSVVALPLSLGPDYRHLVQLAIAGDFVEGVELQVAAGGGSEGDGVADPVPESQDPPNRAELLARAFKTYDRITLVGQPAPIYGIVEVTTIAGDKVDKFDAEKMTDFGNHLVRLHRYVVNEGRLGNVMTTRPGDLQQVAKIELADNLRNRIERKKRSIPRGGGRLKERADFVVELLGWAGQELWVYDEAMAQALHYYQDSGKDIEGLRLQQRVLQARGDLAGEFRLLDQIDPIHRETAFRYEGLGRLQARLGLSIEAEQNLARAVQLAPQDARPHAALAEFLLAHGRSGEALAAARAAERAFGSLIDDADKVRVARLLVGCHLAVSDIDSAKNARARISASIAPRYLDGCIAYAAGEVQAAAEMFNAATTAVGGTRAARYEARLGEAAALLRLRRWQESHDAFVQVHDEAPLLRHRAAAGLSLLYQRIGDLENALAWADRALEADPQDAYSHYLRGRALRLSSQFQNAEQAQAAALTRHDDFVHAIVEMARLLSVQADGALGATQAQFAVDAMRYSDRAVALSPRPRPELFEFQGLRHVAAADPRGAMTAFERARDAAEGPDELFARGAIAVVDYSLGRVDLALSTLERLREDLGKDDPVSVWADATITAIDDHSQKEMLEDRFERQDVGSIWLTEHDGSLRAAIARGRLVFDGSYSRQGRGEVWAERSSAVQRGKNFLAVGCTLQLGSNQPRSSGFAGIRLQTQQGASGRTDFKIEFGVREGSPYLLYIDNRDEPRRPALDVQGFELRGEQKLELRVLPRDEGRTFVLQAAWNDQVVAQAELKSLSSSTQTELKTVLFARGNKGSEVDVAFDDYVLERKKER